MPIIAGVCAWSAHAADLVAHADITIFMLAAAPDHAEPQNLEPHKCKGWSWVSWTELRALPSERMFVPLINLLGDPSHASLTTDAAGT